MFLRIDGAIYYITDTLFMRYTYIKHQSWIFRFRVSGIDLSLGSGSCNALILFILFRNPSTEGISLSNIFLARDGRPSVKICSICVIVSTCCMN